MVKSDKMEKRKKRKENKINGNNKTTNTKVKEIRAESLIIWFDRSGNEHTK